MDGGEEKEGDPFAWISGHCHVSSSQEEMLRNAPYVLPNLAPGVSHNGEDEEEEEEEEFRTPPKSHSLSSPSEAVACGGARDEDDVEEENTRANTQRTENATLIHGKLPSDFCTSFQEDDEAAEKEDVAARNGQGSPRVSVDIGDGGVDSTGQGDGRAGNSSRDEIDEDELTENLLKVLDLLAKQQMQRRPAYEEKVDIIGSATQAGITFPRPSWYSEESDDDDNSN